MKPGVSVRVCMVSEMQNWKFQYYYQANSLSIKQPNQRYRLLFEGYFHDLQHFKKVLADLLDLFVQIILPKTINRTN